VQPQILRPAPVEGDGVVLARVAAHPHDKPLLRGDLERRGLFAARTRCLGAAPVAIGLQRVLHLADLRPVGREVQIDLELAQEVKLLLGGFDQLRNAGASAFGFVVLLEIVLGIFERRQCRIDRDLQLRPIDLVLRPQDRLAGGERILVGEQQLTALPQVLEGRLIAQRALQRVQFFLHARLCLRDHRLHGLLGSAVRPLTDHHAVIRFQRLAHSGARSPVLEVGQPVSRERRRDAVFQRHAGLPASRLKRAEQVLDHAEQGPGAGVGGSRVDRAGRPEDHFLGKLRA